MSAPDGRTRFPIPLVGTATILAVLVLLTPVLVDTGGPAAGSVFTQAELVVDPGSGAGPLHLYLHGIGNVRYAELSLALADNYSWGQGVPSGWGAATNGSGLVELSAESALGTVAVNATAHYVDSSGGSTWYFALLGLSETGSTMRFVSFTSGVVVPSSIPLASSDFPYAILLANVGPGAPS